MKKPAIKVIKRNKINEPAQAPVAANVLKTENEVNLEIAGEVSSWITERGETNNTEKIFSDSKISEWKLLP